MDEHDENKVVPLLYEAQITDKLLLTDQSYDRDKFMNWCDTSWDEVMILNPSFDADQDREKLFMHVCAGVWENKK